MLSRLNFEESVGQALFDLENTNNELKSDLKDLYINSAVQIDVSGNRKAVVIHVPYRLRKGFRKIHVRLVRELEKKIQWQVTVSEVEALHELYKKLSNSIIEDGLIHREEFQLALFRNKNKKNLFADRIFDLFDLKRNGVIEFGEFVISLGVFHPNAALEDKISFAFRLYDLRQTGFIEREELNEMVLALLHESDLVLSEDMIETIVDKTFSDADINGDGRIDQEEWTAFVSKHPSLIKNLTLPYLKDITLAFPSFVVRTEIEESDM